MKRILNMVYCFCDEVVAARPRSESSLVNSRRFLAHPRRFKTRHLSRFAAFTLIEIMIVITLLGLIGTFAVTNFMAKLQEGNRKGTKVLIQGLRTSLDDFMRTCNSYPTNGQGGLDALHTPPSDGSCKDYDPNGYVKDKKLPKDAWGHAFIYLCDDGKKYVLKSLGRDGKEGGTGDDKDISTEDPDF